MSFLHAYLLGGLSLVAVPVLIHLVTREKPKQIRFPAFRFLVQKFQTNRRKLRLHQLLLLLLRMLLIAALCTALARPRLYSDRLSFLSDAQPVVAIMLFDTSPSMEFERGGLTRLEDARKRALELLEELPPSSRVAILDSAERGGEFLDRKPLIRERIQAIQIQAANAPITRLMDRALSLFKEAERDAEGGDPPPRYLYLFSDRTRACWDATDVRGLTLPEGVSTMFVDVGIAEPEDVAIDRIEIDPPAAPLGSLVRVRTFIRATGKRVDRKVTCQVGFSGRVQEKVAQVEANSLQAVTFELRTARPGETEGDALQAGSHQIVVQLEGSDRLPFNNNRFATFVVRPGRKILTLMDNPRGEFATEFWQPLLETLRYSSEVRSIADTGTLALASYDVVWVFQPATVSEENWLALKQFVRDGGHLAVVPGGAEVEPRFRTESAREILPAALGGIVTTTELGVPWKFDLGNRSALMAPFLRWRRERDNVEFLRKEGLPSARRFWKVSPSAETRVIASFDDIENSPALLERESGQGKVIQFTTRLDTLGEKMPFADTPRRWTTYWDSSFGLVLVDKVNRYLAGDSVAPDWNYFCGETVNLPLSAQRENSAFTLTGPGLPPQGSPLTIPPPDPATKETERVLPISRTTLPGNYVVSQGRGAVSKPWERFSANIRPEENLLDQVSREEIEKILGPDTVLAVDHSLSLREAIARKPQPLELLPWLMLLLLLLLYLEGVLGNRNRESSLERTPPGSAQAVGQTAKTLALWLSIGATAGLGIGLLTSGSSSTASGSGLFASICVMALLGAAFGIVRVAAFPARDGAILGGLLGSMVGVLYGWLILAPTGKPEGVIAVFLGMLIGGTLLAGAGWVLGMSASEEGTS